MTGGKWSDDTVTGNKWSDDTVTVNKWSPARYQAASGLTIR